MDMNMKNLDLEEVLRTGVDPDELIKDFTAQLTKAKNKIEEEKKDKETKVKKECIDSARSKAVEAILEYTAALGFTSDKDLTDDLIDMFKEVEDEILPLLDWLNDFVKREKRSENSDSDSIIEAFLKTL